MKKLSFVIAVMCISMISFSQTTKDHIEQLAKDPKTTENAAKADVYITKNKEIIGDTTSKRLTNPRSVPKTIRKKKNRSN